MTLTSFSLLPDFLVTHVFIVPRVKFSAALFLVDANILDVLHLQFFMEHSSHNKLNKGTKICSEIVNCSMQAANLSFIEWIYHLYYRH